MLEIDGSTGEGGGQILRSSLLLALVTRTPVRLRRIRAGREKPGLRPQHLAAVEAAAAVGRARVEGAEVGSRQLTFVPGEVVPGEYRFDIGTAGSATLVLQTVLPALATAAAPSHLTVEGGTHNPLAPPYDFIERVYLPLFARMGPRFQARLDRPGFYPAGGGKIRLEVQPAPALAPFDLLERGAPLRVEARALVSRLPRHVAERELAVVRRELGWPQGALHVVEETRARGPGNALLLEVEHEGLTELVSAQGQKGVPAERVAEAAVAELQAYLAGGQPVGEHLADQLLLPLALAGGGRFRTGPLSLHATTHIELLGRFLPVAIEAVEVAPGVHEVSVRSASPIR